MEEEAKVNQPHHDLHIRFSIPLSSVNEALDPAGAAAKRKRELKKANKNSALHHSASFSKLTFHSSDPFNQGVGFGTSTLDGAGSATLVLRLSDERCTSIPTVFITHKAHALTALHLSVYIQHWKTCPGSYTALLASTRSIRNAGAGVT
jgi:hypothetical protein